MRTLAVFLQLAFCAMAASGAAAWGVYSLRVHCLRTRNEHSGDSSDAVFWNGFLALTVLLPALLIPAVFSPLAGAAVALLALSAAGAAFLYSPVLQVRRRQRRAERASSQSLAAAVARHEQILAHWQQYELDLSRVIDYPTMSDVRVPATAALMRAMRTAELARIYADLDAGNVAGSNPTGHNLVGHLAGPELIGEAATASSRDYDHAVARLERLLADAERAAGVPEPQRFMVRDFRQTRGGNGDVRRRLAGLV